MIAQNETCKHDAKDFHPEFLSLDYVRSGKALAKVMNAGAQYKTECRRARDHDKHGCRMGGGPAGKLRPNSKVVGFLVERWRNEASRRMKR